MTLTTVVSRDDDSWIGLQYNIKQHYWLDGSTSTYRRWAAGEPNDKTYCIVMNTDGEFKDEPDCNDKFGFVCKRSAG